MYLPNQLPSKLRKLDAEHQQSNGHNKNNDESLDCGTRKSKRMGRKERKRAQSDKDEMLAPPSSPTIQQPGPSTPQHNGGSFMARSWARISGRRRRRKHANDPQLSAEVPEQNGWRPASANLAQLAHLRCESAQVVAAEANGEEETRKRHFLNRGMDRIRRSIRRSLRRNSQGQAAKSLTTAQAAVATEELPTSSAANSNGSGSNGHQVASKNYCHGDEIAVRSAACSFAVKYLGSCEVFESRGMSVCESALQHLRSRKRTVKALLYISGDGIRVVDQENNRGLIVDQTIEKVSFCAPDRHNEKGFAYICRDGATRRWMCHGFHSVKDTGERLSHAVGCAFTVCLEKKRKRDAETAAYRNAQALAQSLNSPRMEENGTEFARTNQGYRSFRQLSIAERRCDPQKAILVEHCGGTQQDAGAGHVNSAAAHLAATPRPSPNPNLFERTGSLRAPSASTPSAVPSIPPIPGPKPSFSRFNSLPSGSERLNSMPRMSLYNEPIWEGDDDSSSEQQRTEPNEQPQHPHQNGFAQTQLARDRFYRTLPHTVPSFVQAGNWLSFAAAEVPPTIPEEDRSPSQQQMNGTVEENSFDPFGGPAVPPPPPRADDWLEQTFQRASSLSTLKTTPLSAGTPKTNWPASQQGWATFPHSQSFDVATTRNWPGNGQQQHLNGGQNGAMNGGTSGPPPAHIPPPLPPWARPADPSSANHVVSAATKAHKPSAIPRPLPNHKVAAKGAHQPDGAAPVSAEMTDSGVDVANASMASGAGNRGHSRKQSGSRRIEYQLLQETDTPQSPPKAGQSVLAAKLERDGGRPPLLTDPFDVHWSQRVLEETARQRTGKRDSLAEAEKMFGWESGSTSEWTQRQAVDQETEERRATKERTRLRLLECGRKFREEKAKAEQSQQGSSSLPGGTVSGSQQLAPKKVAESSQKPAKEECRADERIAEAHRQTEAKQLAAPLLAELGLSPEKEQKKTKKPKNKGKKAKNKGKKAKNKRNKPKNKGNKPKKMKPLSQQSPEDSQNVNMQLERGEAMQNRKKMWEPPFSKSDPPPGKSASQKLNEKAEGKESPGLALMKEMSQRMNQMEKRLDDQKEAMDCQKEETDGLRKDIEDLKKRLELTERAASPNMLRDMVAAFVRPFSFRNGSSSFVLLGGPISSKISVQRKRKGALRTF